MNTTEDKEDISVDKNGEKSGTAAESSENENKAIDGGEYNNLSFSKKDKVVSKEIEELQKALAEAQAKADENWDKVLRANADVENMRRRSKVEMEKASKFATDRFAKELLDVVDSLDKGLEATKNDAADVKTLTDGMELTHKLLLNTLEKFGIKELNPVGETFDPTKHEALSMQATDEVEANKVLFVVQKGFSIHDRILRPARVIVAKELDS